MELLRGHLPMSITQVILLSVTITLEAVYAVILINNGKALKSSETMIAARDSFRKIYRSEWFLFFPLGVVATNILQFFFLKWLFALQVSSYNAIYYVDYSLGTIYICAGLQSIKTYYVMRSLILKLYLKKDFYNYRAYYAPEILSPYCIDEPYKTRKDLRTLNKAFLIFSIISTMIVLCDMDLSLHEYAYFTENGFHYSTYWSDEEQFYAYTDFKHVYLVDHYTTFANVKDDRDYYAFQFKDGKIWTLRNNKLDTNAVDMVLKKSGLRLTRIASLPNG
jgi:hypothetical protein